MKALVLVGVLISTGLAVLAAVLVLERTRNRADYVGSAPSGFRLPGFTLASYAGGTVSSESLRGKVAVVTFLESKCEEACPVIASRVAQGLRLLSPEQRRRVVALAVSVGPEDDTPADVRAFLRRHRAERELLYLVGSEDELRPVWGAFQILSSVDSGNPDVHSAPVRIYDRRGRWVSTLHAGADLTPESLRHDLLEAGAR